MEEEEWEEEEVVETERRGGEDEEQEEDEGSLGHRLHFCAEGPSQMDLLGKIMKLSALPST